MVKLADYHMHMCGSVISPDVILRSVLALEIQWEMHPAQLLSLQIQNFKDPVVQETEAPIEIAHKTTFTLLGIPITVREDYPMSLIRLMKGSHPVAHIDGLAIPIAYGEPADFDAHWKNEKEKYDKIWRELEQSSLQSK